MQKINSYLPQANIWHASMIELTFKILARDNCSYSLSFVLLPVHFSMHFVVVLCVCSREALRCRRFYLFVFLNCSVSSSLCRIHADKSYTLNFYNSSGLWVYQRQYFMLKYAYSAIWHMLCILGWCSVAVVGFMLWFITIIYEFCILLLLRTECNVRPTNTFLNDLWFYFLRWLRPFCPQTLSTRSEKIAQN